MEIKFVVIGEPFGKKRPRARVIGKHASVYNDPANQNYELKVVNAFNQVYHGEYPMFDENPASVTQHLHFHSQRRPCPSGVGLDRGSRAAFPSRRICR